MFKLSKALNADQLAEYHKNEYSSPKEQYWSQGNTLVGQWQGGLAEKVGLTGAVTEEQFSRLSQGKDPNTGEQIIRHRQSTPYTNAQGEIVKPAQHIAGWDGTFSPPKSVSITALVGGDERIRDAHRSAVNTALSELERYTQARMGGNASSQTTGKFVAAKFEHDTARPVDGYAAPQLHTHAVIFNITEAEKNRAIQPQSLFESQQFATAVYQSELTHRLKDLGYEITAGKSGAPEIAGYTQEYLDASSLRRQQIEEVLARSGHTGAKAAEIAAHNTRDKKMILSPKEVIAAHHQVAAEFGNQADRVIAEAKERAEKLTAIRVPDVEKRSHEAVTYAKQRNFEREAVTDERDLMRDALRRGMGDVRYSQIRTDFEHRHNAGEFNEIDGKKYDAARQFSTRETMAAELANIRFMQQGQNGLQPIMELEEAAAHATTRPFLNPAQKGAIEEILTSPHRVHGLQGLAGTGKTTTLEAIREGAEHKGFEVEAFAPTNRAAGQLRDAGISADTLQSFLVKKEEQFGQDERHLYMLDESSLASTHQMQAFLKKLGPQDRVLLIGDIRQHQGVDAGKPFEQMQQAGMQTAQLDKIMRQKDPELLQAVEYLSRNETQKGIEMLGAQGRITEVIDRSQRIEAIAKDYVAQPLNTLVISPDNASRQDINQTVRIHLQDSGVLTSENHQLSVLTPRPDLTNIDRTWAQNYQADDVLLYNKGSKKIGIEAGSYAKVLSTDPAANEITVQLNDGREITYDPKRLRGINAYREIEREFAQGDRLQFTTTNKDLGFSNRDLGTIESIDGDMISVRLDGDNPRSITFDSSQMRHVDHGYAVTSHSSQGLTAERVIVNIDSNTHPDLINTRFAYVSISRAQHDARIYTDNAAELAEKLSSDVTKTSAVDYHLSPSAQEPQQAEKLLLDQDSTETELPSPQVTTSTLNPANEKEIRMADTNGETYTPVGNVTYINPNGTVHSPSDTVTLDNTMKEDRLEERLEEQLDEQLEELDEHMEDAELGLGL